MHLAVPSRRALGLTAVGAIAMSTTVLSLGGVAQAAAVETTSPFGVTYDYDGATDTWVVPAGYCSIDWYLEGAQGGAGDLGEAGGLGGSLAVTTYLTNTTVATTFTMAPGALGGDASTGAAGAGGVNPLDPAYDGGAGQVDGGPAAGGGAGAASLVRGSDDSQLYAFGGNGGSADDLGGYPAHSSNGVFASTSLPPVHGVDANGGAGRISATATLCAPAQPSLWLEGDDGKIFVHVSEGVGGDVATTGYEYTRDGGTTWSALTTTTVDGGLVGTISGLTNGTKYTIQIQAIAANGGRSEATAPQTAMVYKPIGAPTNVVATKGPSSIVLTWDAPTTPGTFDLAGYVVGGDAVSVTGDGGSGIACETAADVRRCVLVAEPGWTHTLGVTPVDSAGNPGLHSASVTVSDVAQSAVPSTVPAKTGDLVRPAGQSGSVAPGATVRITGGGYLANSTVTLIVYSEPQVLTTTVADANGNIDVTVTVPAGLAAGNHTLVAAGVDAQGNTHYLTLPITVTGGTAVLALTGFSALPYAGAGALALLAGGGLLVAARRRTAA